MISRLKGTIVSRTPSEVVIDVNGVGYQLSVPAPTSEALEGVRGEAVLLTHLHVREDVLQLFGFATEAERETFRLLLSVNGIGPKVALGILSGIRVPELRSAIARGNAPLLSSVPGVGRKTAERLIVELRGKMTDDESSPHIVPSSSGQLKIRSEAIVALMSLGHNRAAAEKAVRSAVADSPGVELTLEELVRTSLAHTAR
jgi:Holliday junction DNA helicase RuvA